MFDILITFTMIAFQDDDANKVQQMMVNTNHPATRSFLFDSKDIQGLSERGDQYYPPAQIKLARTVRPESESAMGMTMDIEELRPNCFPKFPKDDRAST